MVGFGVGGNLPVDGTLFIEFIPGKHQYLLTLLSIWWAIGQVVGSLIAVSDNRCAQCRKRADNAVGFPGQLRMSHP